MDRNETLDDIAAELRSWHGQTWDMISDRIEASAKRETVTNLNGLPVAFRETQSAVHNEPCVRQTVHNAAKMREALVKSKKAICHHAKYVCDSLSWENSNVQSNCADILCANRDLCEAKTAINAALAAPPRNCDRPECSTPKGEAQEWAKHCSAFADKDEECAGCIHQHQEHEAPCVVEWLLATAAQEGGDHADA